MDVNRELHPSSCTWGYNYPGMQLGRWCIRCATLSPNLQMFSLTFIKHDNAQQDLFSLIILKWRGILKGRIIKNRCLNKRMCLQFFLVAL